MGNHEEQASPERADADDRQETFPAARERERAFIEACRLAREERGWSQREIARQLTARGLPLHQSSIAKLERPGDDRRPLTLAEAIVLSDVLRVSLLPYVAIGTDPEVGEAMLREMITQDRLWTYVRDVEELLERFAERQNALHRAFFDAPGRVGMWAHGLLEAGEHPLDGPDEPPSDLLERSLRRARHQWSLDADPGTQAPDPAPGSDRG